MSAPHIILDNLLSLCQKLPDLVEVWRSYNKNNFVFVFETRCICFHEVFVIMFLFFFSNFVLCSDVLFLSFSLLYLCCEL